MKKIILISIIAFLFFSSSCGKETKDGSGNPEENISQDFSLKNDSSFVSIDTSSFQMSALKGLNDMCKKYKVNITYFLGPYNAVYCKQYNPEYLEQHEKVIRDIKHFLKNENANYIDGSDLSYVSGTFIDKQHHSEYAAWIIADRISKYYEENR